jgi:hypothetical protein
MPNKLRPLIGQVNHLRGLLTKPRSELGVVVAENAAELSRRQVQYPTAIGVDQEAAFAPHDDAVHERLNDEEMVPQLTPHPEAVRVAPIIHWPPRSIAGDSLQQSVGGEFVV